jgi:LmbE family N-acetylglucosaminyl deacetylase
MSAGPALVIVAHPDDEIVFFGGVIGDLVATSWRVDVVCTISVFGDPVLTGTRRAEFRRACWMAGARAEMLEFEDTAGPMPVQRLTAALRRINDTREYASVYTHGVWGEYGHQHHRDVCVAVHRAFARGVSSLAGPLPPACRKVLTDAEWHRKRRIAATYHSQRFAFDWCSREEAFIRLPQSCVDALYVITNGWSSSDIGQPQGEEVRKAIRAFCDAFEDSGVPFPEVANVPREIWGPTHRRFADHHWTYARVHRGGRVLRSLSSGRRRDQPITSASDG